MLKLGNNAANDQDTERCQRAGLKIHPARFPAALPDFFLRLLIEEGDIVVDPFCGSNTTGAIAERLNRRWLAIESVETYLEGSRFRFADCGTDCSPRGSLDARWGFAPFRLGHAAAPPKRA